MLNIRNILCELLKSALSDDMHNINKVSFTFNLPTFSREKMFALRVQFL